MKMTKMINLQRNFLSAIRSASLFCLIFMPFLLSASFQGADSCSTVLLKRENVLILGHNLDESTDFEGFVCVNKRNVYKVGSTLLDLRTYTEDLPPSLCWISKYGSVTWSSLGRDLPDAGINEAGLTIEEMSLSGYQYPFDIIRPRLFQMQWIQYLLDNFSTVEEVIQSASFVFPDGWSWHYFVADKQGNCATLEYIHNKLVVHTGQDMPVKALCNTSYDEELNRLKHYRGFGGKQEINIKKRNKYPRFVRAASMLRDYNPKAKGSAVDYVFAILKNLGGSLTRRSYVVDIKNGIVYFRTGRFPQIRHFSMQNFDFTNSTASHILNLNIPDKGDVTDLFQDYTFQENHRIAESWVKHVRQMYPETSEEELVKEGLSPEHVERYARYPELSLKKEDVSTKENKYALMPLYWTACLGDMKTATLLVDHNAELNAKTSMGATALMGAAQNGQMNMVRFLVEKGADIDLTDQFGNSALMTALAFGQSDIARFLIGKGANIHLGNKTNMKPLHYAAGNGDIEVVKVLIEQQADLKVRSDTGFNPLMSAAHAGQREIARYLIARGSDINALDDRGNSPLLIAVILRHAGVVEDLIAARADVHAKNKDNITPLKAAFDNKDSKILALLKTAGAKQEDLLPWN